MSTKPILNLKVLSPEGVILEVGQLTSVIVPLSDGGTIGIKPNHGPLIAETTKGSVLYQTESDQKSVELNPGILDIRNNLVLILTPGKTSDSSELLTDPAEMAFDRLIKTLVKAFIPGEERDHEIITDGFEKRDR